MQSRHFRDVFQLIHLGNSCAQWHICFKSLSACTYVFGWQTDKPWECATSCQGGNLEESQSVKNRNLSRLIANLSLQIGQANTTVFIVFQVLCLLILKSKKYPVLVYPVILLVQFLSPAIQTVSNFCYTCDCKLVSDTLLPMFSFKFIVQWECEGLTVVII